MTRSPSASLIPAIGLLALLSCLASPAAAQGGFVNYEVGAVEPLAIAELSIGEVSGKFLLVCNTPEDALEIYRAEYPCEFLTSVPVGLAPVTVRWNAAQGIAYTCNHLGDSVSAVRITATGTVGTQVLPRATLTRTVDVGDEPSDILFLPDNSEAIVSLRSRSGVTIRDGSDLSELRARLVPFALGANPYLADLGVDTPIGVKHPHVMAMVGDRQLYILDRTSDSALLGLDLFAADTTAVAGAAGNPLTNTDPNTRWLGTAGMGSAHFDMEIDSSGSLMFVVGSASKHESLAGEAACQVAPTGFTQSWLWVLDVTAGAAPSLHPEATGTQSNWPSFNLNRDYSNLGGLSEVASTQTVSQPTGLALFEDALGLRKVLVTGFNSDRVLILSPQSTSAPWWQVTQVNVGVFNDASGQNGYTMAGPRAVIVDADITDPSTPTTPGLAYVANTLDNSISVINPHTASEILRFQLRNDPTPAIVRSAREFLYGAHHSGTGTVSCASCHHDGHTDGLAWDLGVGTLDDEIPTGFLEAAASSAGVLDNGVLKFPTEKGKLETQTLRGLVNGDIENVGQFIATNAPYHWRGDRASFLDFRGAFQSLMGRATELPLASMEDYETFVETIHHSPNPEQARDRRIAGAEGTPGSIAGGDGVMRGLKAYHVGEAIGSVTCVHCHATPEGSNNRATESFTSTSMTTDHPAEVGALRHIFDREAIVRTDNTLPDPNDLAVHVWTRAFGLFHEGNVEPIAGPPRHFRKATINDFMYRFFSADPTINGNTTELKAFREALGAFVRQLDTGSSPGIGQSFTLVPGQLASNLDVVRDLVDQTEEANAGVVAWVCANGGHEGWWYDLELGLFRRDGTSTTQNFLYFQGQADTANTYVIFEVVPLGSARRISSDSGTAALLSGSAPSNITLHPMAPATHWERATNLVGSFSGTPIVNNPSIVANELLQTAVLALYQGTPSIDWGVHELKHQPPRRFRVSGDDIRHGARLFLWVNGARAGMPLFPTKYFDENERRIWETTVELDGEMQMALMCGGPLDSDVADVRTFVNTTGAGLDPANDNSYTAVVVNEDGTLSPVITAPIRIQDAR